MRTELSAFGIWRVAQCKQIPNLIEGETQLLGTADETNPCNRFRGILPVARVSSDGLFDQSFSFIKSERFPPDARFLGRLTCRQ